MSSIVDVCLRKKKINEEMELPGILWLMYDLCIVRTWNDKKRIFRWIMSRILIKTRVIIKREFKIFSQEKRYFYFDVVLLLLNWNKRKIRGHHITH